MEASPKSACQGTEVVVPAEPMRNRPGHETRQTRQPSNDDLLATPIRTHAQRFRQHEMTKR